MVDDFAFFEPSASHSRILCIFVTVILHKSGILTPKRQLPLQLRCTAWLFAQAVAVLHITQSQRLLGVTKGWRSLRSSCLPPSLRRLYPFRRIGFPFVYLIADFLDGSRVAISMYKMVGQPSQQDIDRISRQSITDIELTR
jgi:hypothetical protein